MKKKQKKKQKKENKTKDIKFELDHFFKLDAADMVAARQKAILIHHTKDIDTAGNEIEQTVRRVLRSKLPERYYTGHGHIVDSRLKVSPQLDVIIADNKGAPVLFRAEDGTEYFPYEAVYVIGEIKSTYDKSRRYIQKFSENIAEIRANLNRDIIRLDARGKPYSTPQKGSETIIEGGDYANSLFSFLMFVNSEDFKEEEMYEPTEPLHNLLTTTPYSKLPTIICFLDKGLILNTRILSDYMREQVINQRIDLTKTGRKNTVPKADEYWLFLEAGTDDDKIGGTWGHLYHSLMSHLANSYLLEPDMSAYMYHIFRNRITIISISL